MQKVNGILINAATKAGKRFKYFTTKKERAMGIVEIILVLIVVIGLVILFRDQITIFLNGLFGSLNTAAGSLIN